MDLEKNGIKVSYLKGYPSLAAFVASDQDHDSVLYKRFDRLSARNLLYLQSEVAELERQQDELDGEDLQSDDLAAKKTARDWRALKDAATVTGSRAEERMKLILQIREKIKEYREAIMLDSAILSLRRPTKHAHKAFRNTFMNVGGHGEEYPTLGSSSTTLYDNRYDIVGVARPPEEDRLTWFLRKYCSVLFLKQVPSDGSSLAYVSGKRISLVVGLVNVLLAAAFLFGAIYNLYYVERDQIKLGLIAGYTVAFALCIFLVTSAKRPEIFGACAAYAAVLVVFVSGDLGGGLSSKAAQGSGVI